MIGMILNYRGQIIENGTDKGIGKVVIAGEDVWL